MPIWHVGAGPAGAPQVANALKASQPRLPAPKRAVKKGIPPNSKSRKRMQAQQPPPVVSETDLLAALSLPTSPDAVSPSQAALIKYKALNPMNQRKPDAQGTVTAPALSPWTLAAARGPSQQAGNPPPFQGIPKLAAASGAAQPASITFGSWPSPAIAQATGPASGIAASQALIPAAPFGRGNSNSSTPTPQSTASTPNSPGTFGQVPPIALASSLKWPPAPFGRGSTSSALAFPAFGTPPTTPNLFGTPLFGSSPFSSRQKEAVSEKIPSSSPWTLHVSPLVFQD